MVGKILWPGRDASGGKISRRANDRHGHIRRHTNGNHTEDEVVETITHLAFYAGWPSAVSAVGVARDVFRKK